jgi:hypothetical protein
MTARPLAAAFPEIPAGSGPAAIGQTRPWRLSAHFGHQLVMAAFPKADVPLRVSDRRVRWEGDAWSSLVSGAVWAAQSESIEPEDAL